jgi:hypothetical protein
MSDRDAAFRGDKREDDQKFQNILRDNVTTTHLTHHLIISHPIKQYQILKNVNMQCI